MSPQTHRSDPSILNRRTLERDHPVLAPLLLEGMSVLDAGCGTGAITAGMARKVGISGWAAGVDRDESLLAIARQQHQEITNLTFVSGDVLTIDFENRFDIATAARMLQWTSDPLRAVIRMNAAVKPGGRVIVLDYNHVENNWYPDPPPQFQSFYEAFLNWRVANHWSNRMASELPDIFQEAGIKDIQAHANDERTERGDPGFREAAGIWMHVIEGIGPNLVRAGFLTEEQRLAAADFYIRYVENGLERQTLSLKTITGLAEPRR